MRRKSKSDKAAKAAKPAKPTKVKAPKTKRAKTPAVDGIVLVKPTADIYTVMLGVSFLALLIGCLVLWAHIQTYGEFPQWRVPVF